MSLVGLGGGGRSSSGDTYAQLLCATSHNEQQQLHDGLILDTMPVNTTDTAAVGGSTHPNAMPTSWPGFEVDEMWLDTWSSVINQTTSQREGEASATKANTSGHNQEDATTERGRLDEMSLLGVTSRLSLYDNSELGQQAQQSIDTQPHQSLRQKMHSHQQPLHQPMMYPSHQQLTQHHQFQQMQQQQTIHLPSDNLCAMQSQALDDNPVSKARFKSFYKEMSALAKIDVADAYAYGLRMLHQADHECIAWKIAKELADLTRRQNHMSLARHWYEQTHKLNPFASQVWIEHAKMEEECGEFVRREELLQTGLQHCEFNDPLMVRRTHAHRDGIQPR